MARYPLPSFSALWKKHQDIYINIFVLALQRLSDVRCETSDEDAISEMLCPILNTVCFEESQKQDCEIATPDWEKPIQPMTIDELKGGKIRKRPDFTCKLTNPLADIADEHEIPLHIECKRLGSPKSASWELNRNYVFKGIKRFDSPQHEYGKRAHSGMMIGYIVSLSPKEILIDVNSHLHVDAQLEFCCIKSKVHRYQQRLAREHVKPMEFDLIHLWVDLCNTVM